MACQSVTGRETAPAGQAAVICFVSCVGWSGSLVPDDLVEVCPLSRGVMLSLTDATPIRAITARRSLFPPSCTRRPVSELCRHLPCREDDRLTRFRLSHTRGQVRSFRRWCWVSMAGQTLNPAPTTCLLAQASQHLWLVIRNGSCERS